MDKLIETIVEAIRDRKGSDIVSLDLSKLDGAVASCFIICNADSTAQVEAITHKIEEMVEKKVGERAIRVEGLTNGVWVVIDYFDVMVHIFQSELRGFYNLEELWADASITKYKE